MSPRLSSLPRLLGLSTLLLMGLVAGCDDSPPPSRPPMLVQRPDAERSTVSANPALDVLADGQESSTLTVTVRNEGGEPLVGMQVRIEVTGEGATVTPASGITDDSGAVRAALTSTQPGEKRLRVVVQSMGGDVVLGTLTTVSFRAPQATRLAFVEGAPSAVAGTQVSGLEVRVQDAAGRTLSGATPEVTLALGASPEGAVLEGTLTARAVAGVARFPEVVLKKAGTGYTLVASSTGLTAATSPTFDVLPGPPASLTLQPSATRVTAGQGVDVQVALADAFGNRATNYTGTVVLSSSDTSATLPAAYAFTAADGGRHTFQGVVLRRAGSQQLTVTQQATGSTLSGTAALEVLPSAAVRLAFTRQPSNQSVRTALATVQVALLDAFDNKVVDGAPAVTVALQGGASATLGGVTTVAPADGVASFTQLAVDTEGTGYSLAASAQGLAGATSATFDIIDDVPPALPVLTQGASTANSLVVQWDAVGDDGLLGTASGYELRYATTDIVTDADFAAATQVTTGAPQAPGTREQVTLSGLTPGTTYYVALRVTDNRNNARRSATLAASTPNAQVTQLAFTQQPVEGTAGTALSDIRVELRDASGNVVTSANSAVTLTLTQDATNTRTVSAVAGVVTFSGVRVDRAGSGYTFDATSGGLPSVRSGPFSIRPAPATTLELVGLVAPVTAGVSSGVQVTLYDDYGNMATGYRGEVRFTSTDPQATLPGPYTFSSTDAGQASFSVTFTRSGDQTLTVVDSVASTLTDSLTVNVGSGGVDRLELTGLATSVPAGQAQSVTVSARDSLGNLVTGYRGEVRLTSTDPQATLPGLSTFTATDAGQKTLSVTLRTSGAQSVTVTDTVTATLTATAGTTVEPGPVLSLEQGVSGSATAGQQLDVTVTARDAYGNRASGYRGNVTFSSTDSSAVLPGLTSFRAADDGRKTVQVELRTAGNQQLTVTDDADSTLTDTDAVEVSPGAPARLVFTAQPASGRQVRSVLPEVRVALRDSFGNATTASSPDVTLSLNGNTAGTLGGTTTRPPSSGVASFADLSVDQEGSSYTLTATAPELTQATSSLFEVLDDMAPATVNLAAAAASTSSVTVSWTAVGDDGTQGTATSYELRYDTTPLSESSFDNATLVPTSAPQPSGSAESVTVTGLSHTTTYYFALLVTDSAGNTSLSLSNSATTPGPCDTVTCNAPAPSCSADRRVASTFTSQCVVSGDTGSCQDTTQSTPCQTGTLCTSGVCQAVTASDQTGSVIITEFSALGSEFIEIMNTTSAPIDVRGFVLRNLAGQQASLRATTDLDGSAGTAVTLAAGGILYGVPNPASGTVPAGAGFVYGEPGTSFALADTGDILDLANAAGALEDLVDFRAFVTSRTQPLTATDFVGFAGSSTQLDIANLEAAGNDSAGAWCVSFYPLIGARSKVADTRGELNAGCELVVLNEVLIDVSGVDDGKTFIELAGPGGALVGGVQITDIEGKGGAAGALNTDADRAPGETDGIIVLPPGTRIPANGLLIIADGLTDGTTQVPNVVAGVDVIVRDADLENLGGDSVQLLSPDNTLLDVLGHEVDGLALDTNVAFNGIDMYETATALTADVGASLARSDASTDTDHNGDDFRADPTPTPGQPNGTVSVTVTGISPTNTPASATATTSGVLITGTDFGLGYTVTFGGTTASCAVTSSTLLTCTAPANDTAGRVDVTVTSPASVGAPAATLTNGFTYTGALNDLTATSADEADSCIIDGPPEMTVTGGQATELIDGQIYEAGLTDVTDGQVPGIAMEVGYGPLDTDPRLNTVWRFFPATFNAEVFNNDEYSGSIPAPLVSTQTQFSFTVRFTRDEGVNWTYCDLNGAGSDPGLDFQDTEAGVMTVDP